MTDIDIRIEGRAGRITLTRPQALNALTYDMAMAIDGALRDWANDDRVLVLIVDADGDKAFCAGGDIADLYRTGIAGDYDFGRRFWRDEYRMNARMFRFPKPVVTFLQGFVMGGGVGVGCHGSHRIVCDTTRIAMPECGIGLVPDVGGSLLLARAPGRLGDYLGTTGHRMGPGDAIHAGFADYHIDRGDWAALVSDLCHSGDPQAVDAAATPPPPAPLAHRQPWIDRHFAGETLADILTSLRAEDSTEARETLAALERGAPLSMACTIEMMHRLRGPGAGIDRALDLEYRFTHRAMQHGDFLEGVRAAIIDKDRTPGWRHTLDEITRADVAPMLLPLGDAALNLEETQ